MYMICNKCNKEIEDNSKVCSYCGNEIDEKKKISKKAIIILSIVIVVLVIVLAAIFGSNNKKAQSDNGDPFKELTFLNELNTDELFLTLDSGVNDELIGTYAFMTSYNFSKTNRIFALKMDNTAVEIPISSGDENWDGALENLYYSKGKIYFKNDDIFWSVDLNEGNGNYSLKEISFRPLFEKLWFYIADNKLYYLDNGDLNLCDLSTEKCDEQTINLEPDLYLTINDDEISTNIGNVYLEDDRYMYLLSQDEDNRKIYKIDINTPYQDYNVLMANYSEVDEISENAYPLSYEKILKAGDVSFDRYYDGDVHFVVNYQDKKYDIKDYRPITLLPNNYLMVQYYGGYSFGGETEYLNLKTGLIDKDYSIGYNDLYTDIYFISKVK